MSYSAYLASPLWKAIRARVLARDKGKCRSCGKRAWQVHHASYAPAVMEGRDDSQLYAICGGCHLAISFDIQGNKRPQQEQARLTVDCLGSNAKQPRKRSKKAKKRERIQARRERDFAAIPKCLPSPAEIIAGMTPAGGWKRKTLASWGVPWPPIKGWRERLEAEYQRLVGCTG